MAFHDSVNPTVLLAEHRAVAFPASQEIIILGITQTGATFRPSDWAERLCGLVSIFADDQRINYSPYVKPIVAGEVKCVVVDTRLQGLQPEAYDFLMWFARDNELLLRPGRSLGGEQPAPVLARRGD